MSGFTANKPGSAGLLKSPLEEVEFLRLGKPGGKTSKSGIHSLIEGAVEKALTS